MRQKALTLRPLAVFLALLFILAMPMTELKANNNPLCFTARNGAVTVKFDIKSGMHAIKYSIDGTNWSDYTSNNSIVLNADYSVYFRAATDQTSATAFGGSAESNSSRFYFTSSNNGTVEASGNIMSLYGSTCPDLALSQYAFAFMFYNCSTLVKAPELPATSLAANCYEKMFHNCVSLATAPTLSSTNLASHCYCSMFNNCTSLTTIPALNATTLAESCYESMFYGCKSLTSLPTFPTCTLATKCCVSMFQNCTSLMVNLNGTNSWRINAAALTGALSGMFVGTLGTMNSTPEVNTDYYVATFKHTVQNGNWNDINTWNDKIVPTGNDYAVVKHKVVIPDNVTANCSLTSIVTDSAKLTVSPDAVLQSKIIVNRDSTKLIIQADENGMGTVKFENVYVNPKATVQMYFKGGTTTSHDTIYPDWQYRGFIGTPDASQTLENIVIYKWDETNNNVDIWGNSVFYDGYVNKSATGNFTPWNGFAMANFAGEGAVRTYTTTLLPTNKDTTFTLTRTTTAPNGSSTANNGAPDKPCGQVF